MKTSLIKILVVCALLVPQALATAQVISIMDVLRGERFRLDYRPADLPEDFMPVRLKIEGDSSPMDMLMNPMMMFMGMMRSMGSEGEDQGPPMALLSMLDVSWTRGDVVRVEEGRYLVTYKIDLDPTQMMSEKAPAPEELTLKLQLVKLDSIQTISARPGVTRATLVRALSDVPAVSRAEPARRESDAAANAKQLGLAMMMYATDFDDVYPYAQQTKSAFYAIYPYVKNIDLFRTLNPRGGEWRFNMGISGAFLSSIQTPTETPMFFESESWPDGRRLVVFVDGHVRWLDEEAWSALQDRMKPPITRVRQPLPPGYGVAEIDRLMSGGTP